MCKLCETKPVYEFTNRRKLCKRCFVNYFQKKVLYTIRKFGMIQNGDIVGYRRTLGFRDIVLEEVLKMFSERANVNLVKLPSKKINKIAVSSTIDSESCEIMKDIINGHSEKIEKFLPVEGKIIKPLYLFLDKEVLLYAKIRKLKFRQMNFSKDRIGKFIDESETKHPEIKRAIINGFLKLYG